MAIEPGGTIIHWLRRYKPASLRLHLADGTSKVLQRPQAERGRWTQLEAAILTLMPSFIEALDADGEAIASRTLELEDADDAPKAPPPPPNADPMTVMVSGLPTIVQLIVDAADASAARHADAYRLAFEQQLSLVKVLADRLHGLEKAYQAVLMNQATVQAEAADPNQALVAQVIGHAMSNGMGANGASKPVTTEPKQ